MKIKINNNTIYVDLEDTIEICGEEDNPPVFNKEDLPQLIGALEGILDHLNSKES